jgi:uncharacterized membrane protein
MTEMTSLPRGGATVPPLSRFIRLEAATMLAFLGFALALAGLGVATYLTVVHYAHQPIACTGLGDCEYVNSSEYADVAGVPVALLGAGAYAIIAALIAALSLRNDVRLLVAAWAVALASFLFSMYLTYIELWVLDAVCVYCVASASLVSGLFAALSAAVWLRREEVFDNV